jgi:hypothetical protein
MVTDKQKPCRGWPVWLRVVVSIGCVMLAHWVYAGWEWRRSLGCGPGVTFSPTGCYIGWKSSMALAVESLHAISPPGLLFWKLTYAVGNVLPAGLLAAGAYAGLTCRFGRTRRDVETHCRSCRYILRGISVPQCPECGERI